MEAEGKKKKKWRMRVKTREDELRQERRKEMKGE